MRKISAGAASGSKPASSPPVRAPIPWFQECGPRIVQNNEIVAFDTDLIGAYGICVDISRTLWIGDERPTEAMIYAMRHGVEHIRDQHAAAEARRLHPRHRQELPPPG